MLPYLVRSQLVSWIRCLRNFCIFDFVMFINFFPSEKIQRSELSLDGAQAEENGNDKVVSLDNKAMRSQLVANTSSPSFHELCAMGPNGSAPFPRKTHKCCVYIASKNKYCARLNSIQAFSDINRDVSFNSTGFCDFSLFLFYFLSQLFYQWR